MAAAFRFEAPRSRTSKSSKSYEAAGIRVDELRGLRSALACSIMIDSPRSEPRAPARHGLPFVNPRVVAIRALPTERRHAFVLAVARAERSARTPLGVERSVAIEPRTRGRAREFVPRTRRLSSASIAAMRLHRCSCSWQRRRERCSLSWKTCTAHLAYEREPLDTDPFRRIRGVTEPTRAREIEPVSRRTRCSARTRRSLCSAANRTPRVVHQAGGVASRGR